MAVAEIWLAADVRSAREARAFLVATLNGWAVSGYQDDAVLLLSELVANAALHGNSEIGVRIELKRDCLLLSVSDGSPREPVVRHYSDQATTGRGLTLVSALARQWGVHPGPAGGKTVWAEVGADRALPSSLEATTGFPVFRGGGPDARPGARPGPGAGRGSSSGQPARMPASGAGPEGTTNRLRGA